MHVKMEFSDKNAMHYAKLHSNKCSRAILLEDYRPLKSIGLYASCYAKMEFSDKNPMRLMLLRASMQASC